MKKHTILFLAANPTGTDRLALDRQAHGIQAELERSGWRDHFAFVTRWATEPLDLLRELRKIRPTVVHFSGHGALHAATALPSSPGPSRDDTSGRADDDADDRCDGLMFQGRDGAPRAVSAASLGAAFDAAGSSVKLVVLNACYSEAAAKVLLTRVECVVGMDGAIRDDAARSFAIGFYGGLGERESIAAAHRGGCAAIGLGGFDEADHPKLRVRQGVDASKLILAGSTQAPARTPAGASVDHGGTRARVRRRAEAALPLTVAAITGAAGLGLLAVMLSTGSTLVGLGLTGYVWYVLLLLLGLAAAVTVFALFKSYARYTGKLMNGTLELGGPIVVALLVVVLGFYLVPAPAQQFEVTVFLHGEAGDQDVVLRNSGKLSLDLGADKRIEDVGSKGEVRFAGVPTDMRGREVGLALVDDTYELAETRPGILLSREVFYVPVRAKRLPLVGYVLDGRGKPLKNAHASIAGADANTDADGRFEISLPVNLPAGDRTITISAPGYETSHDQAVPGSNPLQVQLSASAGSGDGR